MRSAAWLVVVAATAFVLSAQLARCIDLDRLLPEREPVLGAGNRVSLPAGDAPGGIGDSEVLIAELREVELAGAISVPRERELRESLQRGVGQPLTAGGLVGLLDRVVAHYEAQGYPVVEVLVPEQEITGGRVRLEVVEGVIGDVAVAGGAHLGGQRIGLAPGERLTMGGLQGELDWLNRNRFADARLAVAPGDAMAEADLLFQLSDRRPLRVFTGFENSGVDVVGEDRLFAGFEWGNAFGLGHRLIYQATLGTEAGAFRGHAVDYRIPLDWRHELNLLAAIVNSETTLEDGIATGGESWQLGAHYVVPLRRRGDWRHEIAAGFDFKSTDNNLEFGGAEVFSSAVDLAQLAGRYTAALDRPGRHTALTGEVAYSPGGLTDANGDEAFRGVRADAASDYTYLRGQVLHVQRLPAGASLLVRAGGQWADAPLLPSEQLALGGYDRVRGYPERDGLGDRGYWGSLELRSPGLLGDDLQLLAFVDCGRSWMENGGGERDLLAAGPGVRYRLLGQASLRFDYGWQLDGGGSQAHFGLQLEY